MGIGIVAFSQVTYETSGIHLGETGSLKELQFIGLFWHWSENAWLSIIWADLWVSDSLGVQAAAITL